MSTALHYRSNLRDIFFNLFEFLDIGQATLGKAPFTSMDEETAKDTLLAFERLCVEEFAPSFAEADRTPLKLDAMGNVTLPDCLKASMKAFYAADWHRLDMPERLGGFGAPPTVYWATAEMMAAANANATFYVSGTFVSKVIERLGTPSQVARFLQPMIDRHWGGTMVLTEPDAGSDVGAGRTKARHVEGDVWELEGTKRFITNGDFDGTENIIHLVLARPEGAGPGTRGLSMFIVPKYWVNEDGSLGERNGAFVTGIEKKMGIKASATCEMTFGDRLPCKGFLVGEVHDGIRQMFQVIEWARMLVGTKSMATLSTAYLNALAYTKERVQGPALANASDKNAPRVRIIEHPDVRRMLMLQKSFAEGMRALVLYTASIQDQVEILGGHGNAEAKALDRLNDLLLPLVKGYGSEKVYELLATSLQCFGGSGYCQDYPIEQYIRDQKIDSLYEGTTHIQALDLIFRKILRDGGKTFQGLLAQMKETVNDPALERYPRERFNLARAISEIEAIFQVMVDKMAESVNHVGFQANRILFSVAELVIGWLLVRQAIVADRKVKDAVGEDKAFYEGKLAAVRFYCRNVLPGLTLTRKLIENGDLELMDVPEEAF